MKQEESKQAPIGDTYSYKGWINSDKFLKRAFAIYGHMLVAGLIISLPIYILVLLAMFAFSLG